MQLYIAGGSDERLTVVRPLITEAKDCGLIVTYDWTRSPGYDRPLTPAEVKEQALLDLQGVANADLVWYVAPEAKSEGSAVELGAALIRGKPVIASGPHALRESRIFALLAHRIFATHDAAFRAIRIFASHPTAYLDLFSGPRRQDHTSASYGNGWECPAEWAELLKKT